MYHISDLILQQIHGKSQIHTQKTRTLTHRLKKHTHSRTIVFCMNLCETRASESARTRSNVKNESNRIVIKHHGTHFHKKTKKTHLKKGRFLTLVVIVCL